jgi:quinol monooxygenase YgiN
MSYVLIIHEVESYSAWKDIFDRAADLRKKAGEISYQLLRDYRDPNLIVHLSKWEILDNAKKFFESPELVRIRAEAGVKSPKFIYLDQIEQALL